MLTQSWQWEASSLSTYVGADEVNTAGFCSSGSLWGLVMIVPDLVRVLQPLGSLGFIADNDGLIHDIDGPFPDEASSPAWRAGIRARDQLDPDAMRCKFGKLAECGNALAVLGGVDYVLPGHAVAIDLAGCPITRPNRDGAPSNGRCPSLPQSWRSSCSRPTAARSATPRSR